MPIYEFLCPSCHRVYSFLARSTSAAERQPRCPRCGNEDLRKQVSQFSFVRRRGADASAPGEGDLPADEGDLGDGIDDPRVEREMMKLMREAEGMDENDPRQLGRLMRRMAELTGEGLEGEMEEAVRRLEAGEDPERIEEDLGDALDGAMGMDEGVGRAPTRDDGLYEM